MLIIKRHLFCGCLFFKMDFYMAYIVMVHHHCHGLIVMAIQLWPYSYGLYSHGLYSHGIYSHGLCSYGLYNYGAHALPRPAIRSSPGERERARSLCSQRRPRPATSPCATNVGHSQLPVGV